MTNTPPEDLARRVNLVEARLDNLVEATRSLVQNAEIEQQNIAELREQTTRNANAIERLTATTERLTATTERLAAEAAADRQQAAIERQEFNRRIDQQQRSIQQILEYLRDRNGGSSPPN